MGSDPTEEQMRILITGSGGFLGARLARTLLQRDRLTGREIREMVLADLVQPPDDLVSDPRVRPVTGALMETCRSLAGQQFDVVFHLAGAVSAECEQNFDLGMAANLDSTRALLDVMRSFGNRPRFVFASSVAVFGSDPGLPLSRMVFDDSLPTPQSSYGIQKFICEQLVTDYTRKGFIDGQSGRLMTVAVRTSPPNGAASGFLSAIVRDPLSGMDAVCPVPGEMSVAIASPGNTIRALIALAEADRGELGARTAINFPALTVTVGEILDALEKLAGPEVRRRVRMEHNPEIGRIVGSWPSAFCSRRTDHLGLERDRDVESIILEFMNEQKLVARQV